MNLYFVHDDGTVVTPTLRHDPRGHHPLLDPRALPPARREGRGAPGLHRRVARRRRLRPDHRGVRLRHRRRGHPGGHPALERWGGRPRRGDRADDPADPAGPRRHPVRPRGGHLRLDAPGRLSATNRVGAVRTGCVRRATAGGTPGVLGYGSAVSTTSQQPAAPQPGLMVGDYRLLTKIGEGGMGVVHLAQAPDGDRVALKVLRPHIVGDDEARERLAREVASSGACAAARRRDRRRGPVGRDAVRGHPLRPRPLPARAHPAGGPGRGRRPPLVRRRPRGGGDRGPLRRRAAPGHQAVQHPARGPLAGPDRLRPRPPRRGPRLTATGWLLGTPGYLAPEILYGDDATAASDAHSWAATVVFAATGRPPFGRGPRWRSWTGSGAGARPHRRARGPAPARRALPRPRGRRPPRAGRRALLAARAASGPGRRGTRRRAGRRADHAVRPRLAPDEDGTEVLGDDAPTVGVPATSGIDPTTPLTTTSGGHPRRTPRASRERTRPRRTPRPPRRRPPRTPGRRCSSRRGRRT